MSSSGLRRCRRLTTTSFLSTTTAPGRALASGTWARAHKTVSLAGCAHSPRAPSRPPSCLPPASPTTASSTSTAIPRSPSLRRSDNVTQPPSHKAIHHSSKQSISVHAMPELSPADSQSLPLSLSRSLFLSLSLSLSSLSPGDGTTEWSQQSSVSSSGVPRRRSGGPRCRWRPVCRPSLRSCSRPSASSSHSLCRCCSESHRLGCCRRSCRRSFPCCRRSCPRCGCGCCCCCSPCPCRWASWGSAWVWRTCAWPCGP
mmetsp:Transcript_21916/g.85884  ORF Transcript_21916/g.85884 Transcript_21916/m.85884 type:complete len:257 (+) Transcript_21916:1085-1855(+)